MGFISHHRKLATLLRECADYVERDEFHPDMYQAGGLLHAYAGQQSSLKKSQVTTTSKTTATLDSIHVMSSLGKGLKKGLGLVKKKTRVNPSSAQATTHKNADRAMTNLGDLARKAESGHWSKVNDYCDEYFCLACACKEHKTTATPQAVTSTVSATTEQSVRSRSSVRDTPRVNVTTAPSTARPAKPSFQCPVNSSSIVIASGWIAHQRRSKMRVIWKDVLASLVEGSKPGEETTLWIQHETTNRLTDEPELETLHQIPMKWLMGVEYVDYYSTDHRFALKLNNVKDWLLFKCSDKESAQDWVSTLRRVREIAMKDQKVNKPTKHVVEERGETTAPPAEQTKAPKRKRSVELASDRMTVSELHVIARDGGNSTAEVEQQEMKAAVSTIAGSAQSNTAKNKLRHEEEDVEAEMKRHHAVTEEEKQTEEAEQRRHMAEEIERRRKAAKEEEHQRQMEEGQRRRQLTQAEQRRRKLAEEDQRRRQQSEAELLLWKKAEKAQRIMRQMAEEDTRRRKLVEEEQRKRAAEQQTAEQRSQHEEAHPKQWQQQQQQEEQNWKQRQQPPQQPPQQNRQQQQPNQQQPFLGALVAGARRAASPPGQAPPPPRHGHAPPPPQHGQTPPPPPPPQQCGQGAPSSPINLKYAKMAAQDDGDGQAASMTAIKHSILVHWALQPPMLQILRPIDVLISTIHNVFPPAFGVASHEYFCNWKAVKRDDLVGAGNYPVEEKLKKGVRKLRFFLHPDKLPRDLTDEQQFMCKMLWDIISDAWGEFEKHKEELDWI